MSWASLVAAEFLKNKLGNENEQVRIHESTVACDWAGAVMPENHEKSGQYGPRQNSVLTVFFLCPL